MFRVGVRIFTLSKNTVEHFSSHEINIQVLTLLPPVILAIFSLFAVCIQRYVMCYVRSVTDVLIIVLPRFYVACEYNVAIAEAIA